MSVSDTLINTLFDNRYRILRKLGAGGMANVYLAEDEELGRRVAIKILNERYAGDELFIERFRREATAAAGLSHPHIVSIYDRGEAEGTYYIAMEVIEGRSLKDLILRHGKLPVQQAIAYAQQILGALRFAHRNGIIHRDIKPHNILLGHENRLKVTDFGIARAGASQMTETGSIMGTAQYLSPEQARGAPVTASADLYSLGVVLYEMLTGQVPFNGDTPIEIAMKHVNDRPRPPSELVPEVPEELDQIVLRALAKDPDERYQSADDFADDLDRAAAGIPVSAETAAAATAVLSGMPTSATRVLPPDSETRVARRPAPPRYPPAYRYDEPRRRRRSVLPWLVVLALLVAAAIAGWYVFTRIQDDIRASAPVPVPLVVGLEVDLARARLRDEGLEPLVRRRPNADEPAGIVFEQDPDAGTRIAKGDRVTILVSTGVPKALVPRLVGVPFEEAIRTLSDRGLEWRRRDVFSQREPGLVVAQDPKPGETVEEGATVTLNVSKGEDTVAVPDVLRQDHASAEAELVAADFEVEAVSVPSSEPEGLVVGQSPDPGVSAPKGSTVTINVSEGPQTAPVPSVVGQDEQSAITALEDAGFQVSSVDSETTDSSRDGVVIDQNPDGGLEAEAGGTVTIVVARFVEPPPAEEPTPASGEGEGGAGPPGAAPPEPGGNE